MTPLDEMIVKINALANLRQIATNAPIRDSAVTDLVSLVDKKLKELIELL